MPRVYADAYMEMRFKGVSDALLYCPFDTDANDVAQGLSPSTETGAIIFDSPAITPQVGAGAVQLAEATTNLITNPSLETNTTGWAAGGTNTAARSSEQALFGNYSLKCTYQDDVFLSVYEATLTDDDHIYGIWLWIPAAYDGTALQAIFGGFTGIARTAGIVDMTKTDQWQFVYAEGNPDAGDLEGLLLVYESGDVPTVGKFVYIDGAQLEAKAYPTPTAIGDMGAGHSWDGAAHASSSSRVVTDLRYTIDMPSEYTVSLIFSVPWTGEGPSGSLRVFDWYYGAAERVRVLLNATTNTIYLNHQTSVGASADLNIVTDVVPLTKYAVAVTYDGTTLSAYLDGVLLDDSAADPLANVPSTLHIGGIFGAANLNGWLDEFVVLDYALTPAEVANLYDTGVAGRAFNGVWSDVTEDVAIKDRIQVRYGITGVRPTDRVAGAGTMKFALKNGEDNSAELLGYYSPGHANARDAFDIGLPVRLKLTHSGVDYFKFMGTIRSIKVSPGKYRDRKTMVEVVDWLGDAGQHKMDLVGVTVNQTSDQVIDSILANMTKQPNNSDIETGQSMFAYAMDGLRDEKTTALAAIQKVTMSEFGYCYVIGDQIDGGTFRYEDRHTRVLNTTSIATISEDELSQLTVARNDKLIYNIVRATSFPREVGIAPEILYNLSKAIQINAADTATIIARYRDPSQESARISGSDMQTPVISDDYKFGSSEGSGVEDLNASLGVDVTFGANSAKIVLSNNGAVAGYVNLFQLQGDAVRMFDAAIALAEDEDSKLAYGDRPLDISLLFQDDPLEAQDFADITLASWKDPKTLIKKLGFWANQDATRMVDALEVEPGSRITLSESLTALSDDYFVNGVELTIQENNLLFCQWNVTQAEDADYWLLEIVGRGELEEATIVGF